MTFSPATALPVPQQRSAQLVLQLDRKGRALGPFRGPSPIILERGRLVRLDLEKKMQDHQGRFLVRDHAASARIGIELREGRDR